MELQIHIVDDWKKHYHDNIGETELASQSNTGVGDKSLVISRKNKMQSNNSFKQQLVWLKKTERIIQENINLFIEGLQEEGIVIPNVFIFNLLIKNDRWFIAEKNSQIIFEVEH
ncbi:hypothetical protein [Acetobacterium malicum]|nr:hypothetical protein [Acetobacterium dehalogenans]